MLLFFKLKKCMPMFIVILSMTVTGEQGTLETIICQYLPADNLYESNYMVSRRSWILVI